MSVTTLRRLPVPTSEPPFDDEQPFGDEQPGRGPAALPQDVVQGTLALAFVLPSGLPAAPVAPRELRLVPPPDATEDADAVDFGPQPTPTVALPEARCWAGRFTQAVVDVLAGDRPVSQLVRWTSGEVYDAVSGLVVTSNGGAAPAPRGVVRSLHVSQPADGVAEVAALVRRGARCTAVALRLEGLDGRWQCTALELG